MSDWPYEETDGATAEEGLPRWECPEGACDCAAIPIDAETYELSVMLFSAEGVRMNGARCRVLFHGKVANRAQPNADASGWITAEIPHVPAMVLVEWAPAHTPKDPAYPYRRWYYVDVDRNRDEAARRRLHNLGYARRRSLADNVRDFQLDYGEGPATGNVADIEEDLIVFHDEGRVPERRIQSGAGGSGDDEAPSAIPALHSLDLGKGALGAKALAGDAPGASKAKQGPGGGGDKDKPAKKAPQAKPAPPTSKGKVKLPRGSVLKPLSFPTPKEALKAGTAYYEWFRIFSSAKSPTGGDLAAFFWIFGEALMWQVPDTDDWSDWTESYSRLPDKPAGKKTIKDRKRLCRLPCSTNSAQEGADFVYATQAELLAATRDSMGDTFKPNSKDAAPSLLATPKLYDTLYLQADIRFLYRYVHGMDTRSLPDMANEYQAGVNEKIEAALTKTPLGKKTLKAIGTPGKIWAIDDRMDTERINPDSGAKYIAGINYGFHKGNQAPDVKQTAGARHDKNHTDYSQIFVAVAGFCLVMGPKDTNYGWKRTIDVYMSKELAPLVTSTGKPPPSYRYGKTFP